MAEMRDELSIQDLVDITRAVHILKPELDNHMCIGVEMPKPGDRNVIMHMSSNKLDDGNLIIMISADYLLERFGGTGNVAKRS